LGKGELITRQIRICKVHTIRIDVLSQQGYFSNTLVDQSLYFRQDIAWSTVFFLAAQRRNNTKGASVIAANRNRDPARVGRFALCRQNRRKGFQRVHDFDLSLLVVTSALKQRGQSRHIMRTKDSINPWSVGDDRVFIFLRQTTTNGNLHAGVVFFGLFQST